MFVTTKSVDKIFKEYTILKVKTLIEMYVHVPFVEVDR